MSHDDHRLPSHTIATTALQWAEREGWEPGPGDLAAYCAIDDAGWFAHLNSNGEIVTTLSALKYDDSFGFIGLYITRPAELRGKGFGTRVWQAGLDHLKDCRTVGLDGVLEREATYELSGFRHAYVSSRFAAPLAQVARGLAEPNTPLAEHTTGGQQLTPSADATDNPPSQRAVPPNPTIPTIAPAGASEAAVLANFEVTERLFPARREDFLRHWLAIPRSVNLVARSGADIVGWIDIRPSTNGWRVGPLFTLTPTTAQTLLRNAVAAVEANNPNSDSQVFIDVPEPNIRAIQLVEQLGMTRVFQCVRMYKGEAPDLQLNAIFGNTTFELG